MGCAGWAPRGVGGGTRGEGLGRSRRIQICSSSRATNCFRGETKIGETPAEASRKRASPGLAQRAARSARDAADVDRSRVRVFTDVRPLRAESSLAARPRASPPSSSARRLRANPKVRTSREESNLGRNLGTDAMATMTLSREALSIAPWASKLASAFPRATRGHAPKPGRDRGRSRPRDREAARRARSLRGRRDDDDDDDDALDRRGEDTDVLPPEARRELPRARAQVRRAQSRAAVQRARPPRGRRARRSVERHHVSRRASVGGSHRESRAARDPGRSPAERRRRPPRSRPRRAGSRTTSCASSETCS